MNGRFTEVLCIVTVGHVHLCLLAIISTWNALKDLVADYHVVLIPIYEFEGGLMYLQWYKQMLYNLLVELHHPYSLYHLG